MTATIALVLYIVAIVLFALSALSVSVPKVGLTGLGLACFALASLLTHTAAP